MSLAASSDAGSTALGLVLIVVGIAVYWAPTIAGALARKHNLGTIAVWNFFGWFFFFPWIMAWVKVAERPQQPTVVYAQPYWPGDQYGPPPGAGFRPPPVQPQPQPQAEVDRPYGYQ